MGRLIAFDVNDPEHPEFMSDVTLNPESTWWSFSEPFTAGGLVYLSHHASEFVPWLDSASRVSGQTNVVQDAATGIYITNIVPWGTWVGRDYLDVVDYADPRNPVIRKPVNISGALKGLSHNGALLYAVGTRLNLTSYEYAGQYLDALAYDGVTAHLVTSLSLSNTWAPPVVVAGGNIFLGDPGYTSGTNAVAPSLQAWTLTDEGKFERMGVVTTTAPISKMMVFPGMLAVQAWYQNTELFDTSDPSVLRRLGAGTAPSCIWYDLVKADGDSTRGLWLPVGYYGLSHIPISSKAE